MRKCRIYRIIATILMLILAASMLAGCAKKEPEEPTEEETRIEELEYQVNQLKEENETLISERDYYKGMVNSSDTEFFQIFFWQTDSLYSDPEMQFYSDCYCSQPIDSPVFVSDKSIGVELKNGFYVFAAMSTDGLVWSTDGPNLNPIEIEEEEAK